jgi:hypothetical protein
MTNDWPIPTLIGHKIRNIALACAHDQQTIHELIRMIGCEYNRAILGDILPPDNLNVIEEDRRYGMKEYLGGKV